MSREKIKVPEKVFDELTALQREIHFTLNHDETIKKAEDRGYIQAARWIRENERAYKVGFSWGFEPVADEPQGTLRDVPQQEPARVKRTIQRPPPTQTKKQQKPSGSGVFAGIRNWLGKYF